MSTVDLLRAHAPSAPESLHSRVLALRPEPKRTRVRVRPAFVLAGAATLAVAAAVVHGFATSAPKTAAPPRHTPSRAFGSAGSAVQAQTKLAPAIGAVPAPSPGRLQSTSASLSVRVDDLGAKTTEATKIATRLGGYAQSVHYTAGGSATIDVRVPAGRVKQAIAQLGALGTIVAQQISIQDLTSQLERQSAQIAQLRRRVAALKQALASPSLPDAQRVLLQIKLSEAKRALAERLHGRAATVSAGATARISLTLETRRAAAAAPHHRGRLGRMLHDAVGFLAVEGLVVLFALIVASPFAIAFGLVWWYRRRATDRLLME
ncbi:MAG: DUF4349 domain-containing protein [Actinomycetota bacterium]